MRRVLIFIDWFSPAYKAGGPITMIENLVLQLNSELEIFIVTGDRDLGEEAPMPGVVLDTWVEFAANVSVMYVSKPVLSLSFIRRIVNEVNPGVVYCNGMYSVPFTIYPMFLKGFGVIKCKVIVGPHGMLKPSALKYKKCKKMAFLSLMRIMHLPAKVVFHATDADEVEEIRNQLGPVEIFSVMDMPAPPRKAVLTLDKKALHLRLVFIGRVHPIKNLELVLLTLKQVKGNVELRIVGMIEDVEYWNYCQKLMADLSGDIRVVYVGGLGHKDVIKEIDNAHMLFLPTKGENFGHAIYESLSAGKPVLISDQTPWHGLYDAKAGFDLGLTDSMGFLNCLQSAVDWDNQTYKCWSQGAVSYVTRKLDHSKLMENYFNLFS